MRLEIRGAVLACFKLFIGEPIGNCNKLCRGKPNGVTEHDRTRPALPRDGDAPGWWSKWTSPKNRQIVAKRQALSRRTAKLSPFYLIAAQWDAEARDPEKSQKCTITLPVFCQGKIEGLQGRRFLEERHRYDPVRYFSTQFRGFTTQARVAHEV